MLQPRLKILILQAATTAHQAAVAPHPRAAASQPTAATHPHGHQGPDASRGDIQEVQEAAKAPQQNTAVTHSHHPCHPPATQHQGNHQEQHHNGPMEDQVNLGEVLVHPIHQNIHTVMTSPPPSGKGTISSTTSTPSMN